MARQGNWDLLLRMEDLVGPRIDLASIESTVSILRWLGLDWDGEILLQSDDLSPYREGLDSLISNNSVYHCDLSRKEIEQASAAPHEDDPFGKESIRPKDVKLHNQTCEQSGTNWRFIVSDKPYYIKDELLGEKSFPHLDDFVVWTKNDMPAYQLAVVIDDARQGITDVVRGHDLLESAAWQSQIYHAVGAETPSWWHLPLVVGEDGRRLAKRHGDTRLLTYHSQGMKAEQIVGLIAKWCHLTDTYQAISAQEFLQSFDIEAILTDDIVFTTEDEQWLNDSLH